MLEKIRQKWLEWLFAIVVIILTTIATNYATVKRDTNKTIKDEIKEKASIEYVNSQNSETRNYVDKQDENTLRLLNQHTVETSKTNAIMLDWLKAINTKLDRIDYKLNDDK